MTSPTGRKQLMLVGDREMDQLGAQSFDEIKRTLPVESDSAVNAYVRCVADPVLAAAKGQLDESRWEIVVFREASANAFALPGGKVGVHSGLLKVAKTDAQLAAVLGHEVGHVIARHGAERVSTTLAAQGGVTALDLLLRGGRTEPTTASRVFGAIGAPLATVGFIMPFGRSQESESDVIGLDLMADAGFDPRESVELWKNMIAASGGKSPPEFLSTHPSGESRISRLQQKMPAALARFGKAREAGRAPRCDRSA